MLYSCWDYFEVLIFYGYEKSNVFISKFNKDFVDYWVLSDFWVVYWLLFNFLDFIDFFLKIFVEIVIWSIVSNIIFF